MHPTGQYHAHASSTLPSNSLEIASTQQLAEDS